VAPLGAAAAAGRDADHGWVVRSIRSTPPCRTYRIAWTMAGSRHCISVASARGDSLFVYENDLGWDRNRGLGFVVGVGNGNRSKRTEKVQINIGSKLLASCRGIWRMMAMRLEA